MSRSDQRVISSIVNNGIMTVKCENVTCEYDDRIDLVENHRKLSEIGENCKICDSQLSFKTESELYESRLNRVNAKIMVRDKIILDVFKKVLVD